MSVDEKETVIRLVRRVLAPEKPAEPVHHFLFVRVNDDILLEAGYLDLAELKVAIDQSQQTGTPVDVPLFIGHRFQLTTNALRRLITTASEMLAAIEAPVEQEVTK